MKPKVSIITATFNSAAELKKTILSVASQDYQSIEHIIIDGGSTDDTVKVIKDTEGKVSYWVSEKDKGISDAFNKGLKAATGDFVNFQGAGDQFLSDDAISKMMAGIDPQRDMIVCGRIKRVDEEGHLIFETKATFNKWNLLYKMALPHQALFTNKRFFDKYGFFDLDCKYAMDYELLLRAYHSFPPVVMKDVFVSSWQAGGVGSGKIKEVLLEYDYIRNNNKIAPGLLLDLIRIVSFWRAGLYR